MVAKRNRTIQEALQYVADHPEPSSDVALEIPVHELICRQLFEVAMSPDAKVRGSLGRATRAQKLIMDRLVGRRRPGSHPAQMQGNDLEFDDLTQGALAE